jgi:hypothetical protein
MRNNARFVAQGYNQVEGLDFEDTFAPVAHLEGVRILLVFATSKGFKLYQMDVKSAFLNGVIQEEDYVRQPQGFEGPKYLDRVYKLSKVLYGFDMLGLRYFCWSTGMTWRVWIRPSLLLIISLTFYLFRFTWMISSLVAPLTLLCPDFRK